LDGIAEPTRDLISEHLTVSRCDSNVDNELRDSSTASIYAEVVVFASGGPQGQVEGTKNSCLPDVVLSDENCCLAEFDAQVLKGPNVLDPNMGHSHRCRRGCHDVGRCSSWRLVG
jgi:hypothetical protein